MSSNISSNDLINLSSHVVRIPKASIELMNQFIFFSENRHKYLAGDSGNAAPLFFMIGIIDETIESFDQLSRDIILELWAGNRIKTSKEVSIKYAVKEIDVHRIITRCSDLKHFKYIIPLENYLLEVICKTLRPLTYKDIPYFDKKNLKYSQNLYTNILASIYGHVPFSGHLQRKEKILSVYKCIWNPIRRVYAETYDKMLDSIILPFGEVTLEYLFDLLGLESAYEKLVLLYYIFVSCKYEFIKFNEKNILIRKGTFAQITRDILKNCEAPLECKKLISLIRKYYKMEITIRSLNSLALQRDIIRFEGDCYGLPKHWQVKLGR